jgi:hypothetical protein
MSGCLAPTQSTEPHSDLSRNLPSTEPTGAGADPGTAADPDTDSPVPHPHEPRGFTKVTERDFNAGAENGWIQQTYEPGNFTIASDPTAPVSGPNVGRVTWPQGTGDGGTPWRSWFDGWSKRDVYLHFFVKYSSNWYPNPSGVNKIFYLVENGGVNSGEPIIIAAYGTQVMTLSIRTQGAAGPSQFYNLAYDGAQEASAQNEVKPTQAEAAIPAGQWTECEVYIRGNDPGQSNGEVHGWVNGVKVLQYIGIQFLSSRHFDGLRWEPIWGGWARISAPRDMYHSMDYLYVSGR